MLNLLSVSGVSVSVFILSEVNGGVTVVILNCVFVVVGGWGVFVFGGVVGWGGGMVGRGGGVVRGSLVGQSDGSKGEDDENLVTSKLIRFY